MDDTAQGGISGAAQGAGMGAAFGPWGALIGGVAGGILGLAGGNAAAAAKKRQAEEAIRRLRIHNAQVLGEAGVGVASSGVDQGSASLQTYLTDMTAEMKRQLDWTRKTGSTDAAQVQQTATFGAMTDIAGAVFKFGQQNNWWQSSNEPQVK
jgi:hypothetical protein